MDAAARASLGAVIENHLPEALEFLRRLVVVNSFTANRAGVLRNGEIVAAQFAKLGFLEERVRAAHPDFGDHQFLRRPGAGERSLMLVTHLDTVYPAAEEERNHFGWLAEEDRIFGPGVHDNKGGTVMIWLVLRTLQDVAPQVLENVSWLLAANAAEEELVPDFRNAAVRGYRMVVARRWFSRRPADGVRTWLWRVAARDRRMCAFGLRVAAPTREAVITREPTPLSRWQA